MAASSDFLSQSEVDALLKGVTGEADDFHDEPSAEIESPSGVREYNLGSQERIVRGRMPTLELINERFMRNLRIGLFNYMRRAVEISVGHTRIQKYAEFLRNLVVPTNLNLVSAKPLRGNSLFVLDPNLVFLVIDNMFGSDGRFHTRVEGRDFTPTEQRIIRSLLNVIFEEYAKAWSPVCTLNFEYLRSEMNPQFANIATPSEVVVATSFNLEFGGMVTDMHICFPYSMLEPLRDLLNSSMQSDRESAADHRWLNQLRRQLHDAEIGVVAEFGTGSLTLREILQLRPGDVVPIKVPKRVIVEVDHATLMECQYGQNNGHYALMVERFLSASEPEDPLLETPPSSSEAESEPAETAQSQNGENHD